MRDVRNSGSHDRPFTLPAQAYKHFPFCCSSDPAFETFTGDFKTWVIFFGPKGGYAT